MTPAAFYQHLHLVCIMGTGSREFMVLFLGCFLPGDDESSSFGKYRMVVLMHGAANGAAVLCSMVFSGLF